METDNCNAPQECFRILVIDDNAAIHDDFRKVLGTSSSSRLKDELDDFEAAAFGEVAEWTRQITFEIDSAYQGQEGLEKVRGAAADGRPYAVAFVDIRMPPGWDGIETIGHIWKEFDDLQIVICTAYSDYSWEEMARAIGNTDHVLLLKKPFDNVEVLQMAHALSRKWELGRIAARQLVELDAARQQAEDASTAKSEFLSHVSHELRTPLNAILGFGQLLDRDKLNGPQRESVHQILRGGRHLLTLINELLDISRIESGAMTLTLEPVCLSRLVQDVIALVTPLAIEHQVYIQNDVSSDPEVFVRADEQRLNQVLLNVVANAIKYNKTNGSVKIIAAVVTTPDEHESNVLIEVEDTGVGIDERELPKLFTPFERLGADAGATEGTGIGLSLSRRLLELMAGSIHATSHLGVGTTFTISLPAAELRLSERPLVDVARKPPVLRDAPATTSAYGGRAPAL
jgi:signal transduction histidine kinase